MGGIKKGKFMMVIFSITFLSLLWITPLLEHVETICLATAGHTIPTTLGHLPLYIH